MGPAAPRARRVGGAVAGPLLIVGAVLVVLHDFAFGGRITFAQADVAAYWLPTYCHLGTSLAAGHIAAWNPFSLGGTPFAADPQSGWMYLPVMLLFSLFRCDLAIRLYIVLLPILGGLGTYWFLRAEGVRRTAATMGGLVLALAIAGSRLADNIPFSASLTWIPLLLAAGAHYLRSSTWPGRLAWATVTAIAWGQLAAAHLSHGFILGNAAFLAYLAARLASDVRGGRRSGREALAHAGILVPILPLVNLAYFLPRLAYLPRTTLGVGYAGLQDLASRLAGRRILPFQIGPTATPTWPMVFAISPGAYLGAAPLALAFASPWDRTRRHLVVAFGILGAACYFLSLRWVAVTFAPLFRRLPYGDFYLYSPYRFRYLVVPIVAILAGLGLEAWIEAGSFKRRAVMLVPGIAAWGVLPLVVGVWPPRLLLLAAGAAVGGAALVAAIRRPALLVAVPVIVAAELVANGLIGQASSTEFVRTGLNQTFGLRPLTPLLAPTIDPATYVRLDPLAQTIRSDGVGRFLSLNPPHGYLGEEDPGGWPFLTNQRSLLFGIEEAQGYNPVQPIRFWSFDRTVSPRYQAHNVTVFLNPSAAVMDLLQVRWVVAREGAAVEPGDTPLAREGVWTLYRRPDPPPRASVATLWTVVDTGSAALEAVSEPGFDPEARAIVERSPPLRPSRSGPPPGVGSGRADYRWIGDQAARIDVTTSSEGILVVRNNVDPGWHATVDGRPTPILRTDYFLQGVPVGAGRHTVLLTYDDPWIGYGLLGSALALVVVLSLITMLFRRARRAGPSEPQAASRRRFRPRGM